MCSASTRKELRASRSDTSQRSAHFGLKRLSWPKLTAPWHSDDDIMVQAFFLTLVSFVLGAALLRNVLRDLKDYWLR